MKKCITDVELHGKKCIVRVDFNVPLDDNGNITSDNRIVATLPTIKYLLEQNAAIILMSHLGRPKGKVNPAFSLAPVARRLSQLLDTTVLFAPDCIGEQTEKMASELKGGQILLLENLRFYAQEEANDAAFAEKLASYGEVYVNDAFGTAHRAHASTAGVAPFCKVCVCGLLVEKELAFMGKALSDPDRPFVAILGGSKVSDKIGVINNLIDKVDALLIGGGMTYTFLAAQGKNVGTSLCEKDKLELARQLLDKAKQKNVKLLLPVDHVVADKFADDAATLTVDSDSVPDGYMGLDIGEQTLQCYGDIISTARTIIWNGPLGVFEMPNFSRGTYRIAEMIAQSGAVSIIGGGDSASAVKKAGVAKYMTHISTGGGASLEYLEGLPLPGIECLDEL